MSNAHSLDTDAVVANALLLKQQADDLRAELAEARACCERRQGTINHLRAERDDLRLRLRILLGDADPPGWEEVAPEAAY